MIRKLLLATVFMATAASSQAKAGIISLWNFNDAGASGTQSDANTALMFSVDSGSGTMTSSFTSTSIVDFTGTTTNAQNGDAAGVALALQGGTNQVNNGAFLQFNESTVGFSSIVVSFAIQGTSTGFSSDQLQYTTDGINYTNYLSPFKPVASFSAGAGLETFDLSAVTGLNNNANAGFRIVFSGATGSTGNNRIDNLLVSGSSAVAVPEPASVALLGLGLAGSLMAFRRKRA